MKIWTCYDNLAAQQWTYTPDNLIILANKDMCMSFSFCFVEVAFVPTFGWLEVSLKHSPSLLSGKLMLEPEKLPELTCTFRIFHSELTILIF
jgi:hypothetical protein